MKIKDWVGKIQQKLILGGIKLDEKPETKVTMVTINEQQQGDPKTMAQGVIEETEETEIRDKKVEIGDLKVIRMEIR